MRTGTIFGVREGTPLARRAKSIGQSSSYCRQLVCWRVGPRLAQSRTANAALPPLLTWMVRATILLSLGILSAWPVACVFGRIAQSQTKATGGVRTAECRPIYSLPPIRYLEWSGWLVQASKRGCIHLYAAILFAAIVAAGVTWSESTSRGPRTECLISSLQKQARFT